MNRATRSYRRNQQGFTLIELLLVFAVIGILAGGIYAYFGTASDRAGLTLTVNRVNSIIADTTELVAGLTSSAHCVTTTVINNGAIPREMISGTTIRNAYGGTAVVASSNLGTGTNNGCSLTYSLVTREDCPRLVRRTQNFADVITVGTTTVKAFAGSLNISTLGTACVQSSTTTVVWSYQVL